MEFNLNALLLTIHLLAAAAWFGAGWYERLMVHPVVHQSGPAGVAIIKRQMERGGGAKWFAPASMLTVLSGIALYWNLGIDPFSVSGAMVTAGAGFGIVALGLGIAVHAPAERRLRAAVNDDNQALILSEAKHLARHTNFSALLVTLAFLLMALRAIVV